MKKYTGKYKRCYENDGPSEKYMSSGAKPKTNRSTKVRGCGAAKKGCTARGPMA